MSSMPERPNFKLNRSPRFSANQLADYMRASTASQRETVIRAAKFPRTTAVVPYTTTRQIIANFLPGAAGGLTAIDGHLTRIDARLRREADGWMQDELKRNIEALEAFKAAFKECRLARVKFNAGPADLTMSLEGVRINTRLDARILETASDGTGYGGGIVLFIAGSDASRRNLDERSKIVAAMVHWSLEAIGGNIEPLPRLCMSFDVFGKTITKAPKAIDRLRANVQSSCREAAGSWDGVAPPSGYDGPDWD
jgi:hypothetical protein